LCGKIANKSLVFALCIRYVVVFNYDQAGFKTTPRVIPWHRGQVGNCAYPITLESVPEINQLTEQVW